jgi:hypothetical protein
MRRCLITILSFFVSTIFCKAQTKFNHTWVSGLFNTYTIKYNGNNFQFVDSIHSISWIQWTGGSNICDSTGNLKIMSNGYFIFNKNKDLIENGDSIGGRKLINHYNGFAPYDQTGFFLPFQNNLFYYVYSTASNTEYDNWFVTGHDAVFDEMAYCKIDMSLNNDSGKVVQREIKLLEQETLSKTQMMACKHANGKDWWVLKQARGPNKIFKFLFTQDTVISYGYQSFAEPVFSIYDQSGQIAFTLDGSKIASTCRGTGKVFVADFNRCTGNISNPKVRAIPAQNVHSPHDTTLTETFTQGLCFSPNKRFLYVSMYNNLMQLDLQDTDTTTDWFHIIGIDTLWNYHQVYSTLYIGPDMKIYIGNGIGNQSNRFRSITNPDAKGSACGYCSHCLVMPGPGLVSPPTMPNYDLGSDSTWCWPLNQSESGERRAEWNFYPNPASETIIIQNATGKKKVLYTALGEAILSTTKNELNVSRLPHGIYYLFCDNTAKKLVVE